MRRDLRRALCPGAWQEASATHRGLMVGGSPFALTVQPGPTELGRCELVAAAEGTAAAAEGAAAPSSPSYTPRPVKCAPLLGTRSICTSRSGRPRRNEGW